MTHYSSQLNFDRTEEPRSSSRPGSRASQALGSSGGGGPSVILYFMNKVWDPGSGGGWVMWETEDTADPTGTYYPDPHGTGFGGCSNYRVQAQRYA